MRVRCSSSARNVPMIAQDGARWFARPPDSRWPSLGVSIVVSASLFTAAVASMRSISVWTETGVRDPARFSLSHGGKDRHPYPVPTLVYDQTIAVLKSAIEKAKLGNDERLRRIDPGQDVRQPLV